MNSRDRVKAALSHEIPDRVPTDLSWGFTPPYEELFYQKTRRKDYNQYFGIDVEQVLMPDSANVHDYSSYMESHPKFELIHCNEWGIGTYKTPTSGHFEHFVAPLRDAQSVKEILDYPMPDFDAAYRLEKVKDKIDRVHESGLAAAAPLAQTLFETAWMIRGLDEFLMDLYDDPECIEALLDRILSIRKKQTESYVKYGCDVLMFGDDIGMQTGMMLTPALWRKYFKPRMAELISLAKDINPQIPVFYHSDGNITEVIDDLVEIGISVLNPVQPECMDPAIIKKRYGKKLAFWGTISVQKTLPFGTPEDVKNEVKTRIQTVGKEGGLLLGPAHMIEPEVPWENLLAFFEAIEEYGYY